MSSLSRVQLHRPGSLLKFIPEEILIHGRDFRLLRVGFEAGGLEPQAFQVRGSPPKNPSFPENLRILSLAIPSTSLFPGTPLIIRSATFLKEWLRGWDK